MKRNILVLFDSLTVRSEAVHYSIELAKRTDSELVFLMLLPLETGEKPMATSRRFKSPESRARDILMRHLDRTEKEDVSAHIIVKIGDPQSELMKFLAGSGTLQAIVWGGRQDLFDSGARGKKAHWLVKTKSMVECSIVVPSLKS